MITQTQQQQQRQPQYSNFGIGQNLGIKHQSYILAYGILTLFLPIAALFSFLYDVVAFIRNDIDLKQQCYFIEIICKPIRWILLYPSQLLLFIAINWLIILMYNSAQYLFLKKIVVFYIGILLIGLSMASMIAIYVIKNLTQLWQLYSIITLSFAAFSIILFISSITLLFQFKSAQNSLTEFVTIALFYQIYKLKIMMVSLFVLLIQVLILFLFALIFMSLVQLVKIGIPIFIVDVLLFVCLLQAIWTMFLLGYAQHYYIFIQTISWIMKPQTQQVGCQLSILIRDIGAIIVGSIFIPILQYFSYGCYFVPFISKQLTLPNDLQEGANMFFHSEFFSKYLGCYTENNFYFVLIRNSNFWEAGQQLSQLVITNIQNAGKTFKFSNTIIIFCRLEIAILSTVIFEILYPYLWLNSELQISVFSLILLGVVIVFQIGQHFQSSFICAYLTNLPQNVVQNVIGDRI